MNIRKLDKSRDERKKYGKNCDIESYEFKFTDVVQFHSVINVVLKTDLESC